ncbi:MAG: lysophospholipid acyltransferase family protein [Polyangia bacterium]|jgi:lauroyl/myristoyl acyltransferase
MSGYGLLARLSRVVGLWVVRVMGAVVAAGYYGLRPALRKNSVTFYQALFPGETRRRALLRTWRQYQDFARLYSERLALEAGKVPAQGLHCERVGEEHFEQARQRGQGVIVVMSHFGRWEIAVRLLAREHRDVTLVMGGQTAGGARAGVDRDLRRAGLDVLTVPEGQGQAVDILQALQVLRRGGIVALSGDRAFAGARLVPLPFLGRTVAVAAAPFALALVSGAPLVVCFAVRLAAGGYRFISHPPLTLTAGDRTRRQAAVASAGSWYLDRLREMLLLYPEQWQTFAPFFIAEAPAKRATKAAG